MQQVQPLTPAMLKVHQRGVVEVFNALWACGVSHGDIALRNLGLSCNAVCIYDLGRTHDHTHDGIDSAQAALAARQRDLPSLETLLASARL